MTTGCRRLDKYKQCPTSVAALSSRAVLSLVGSFFPCTFRGSHDMTSTQGHDLSLDNDSLFAVLAHLDLRMVNISLFLLLVLFRLPLISHSRKRAT